MFQPPSLQQAIDDAGSPMRLLWNVVPGWLPPRIPDGFSGRRDEQRGSLESVSLSDQSHHMRDLFVARPDATRLLADVSANNYAATAVPWHPGPGNDPEGDHDYVRVRATVQPAPYGDFARTHCRTAVF